jgi:RNA polymerase sigma-70 factor (ECF subfamily)
MASPEEGALPIDLSMSVANTRSVSSTPSGPTVADLDAIDRARQGCRDAFGHLYRRYAAMVHGLLLARVPPAEVDDLVQDVFLLAFQRIASLREPAAFGGWLAAITRHRATDFHRSPRLVIHAAVVPEPRVEPEREEALAVLAVIRSLPEAYRETLTLRLVEGMTGPEIAARTGLTPASVRVNLHRGMKMLRERLAGEQGRR